METPGQRVLKFLRLDWENALNHARLELGQLIRSREIYYVPGQSDYLAVSDEIEFLKRDVAYFKARLEEMGGAENGSFNESTFAESANETPQFKEMSCITV